MREDNGEIVIAGEKDEGVGSAGGGARIETVGGSELDARIVPLRAENAQLREMMKIRDAKDEMTEILRAAGARSPGLLFAYAVGDLQFDAEGRVENWRLWLRNSVGHFRSNSGEMWCRGSMQVRAAPLR